MLPNGLKASTANMNMQTMVRLFVVIPRRIFGEGGPSLSESLSDESFEPVELRGEYDGSDSSLRGGVKAML